MRDFVFAMLCGMGIQRVLGPAYARWKLYVGTAAADNADATIGSPSLYGLVELDRACWTVLAVDLRTTHSGPRSWSMRSIGKAVRRERSPKPENWTPRIVRYR